MASKMVRMSTLEQAELQQPPQGIIITYMVRVHPGNLSQSAEFTSVEATKGTKSQEVVRVAVQKLKLGSAENYELAETISSGGQLCKERRLDANENPVKIQLLWPRVSATLAVNHRTNYSFFLRKKESDRQVGTWVEYTDLRPVDSFLSSFLQQSQQKEYDDLCNLPDLNENTLLANLKKRFDTGKIYTYVGSILIAVNPFKFFPIYNPKFVKMYQSKRLGDLPPHIFAIADAAYHKMLYEKTNQCIVISGESGSGKTESTNLLLHHLSALSQRGYYGVGIEQSILGAGPVLEAFGNAKTVHNNNSSRFGKFIQVNYKENGAVHGAVVEKYLLEKSRIVSQAEDERNYHVFYYLLAGASAEERAALALSEPEDYFYLNQSNCYTLEGIDGEFIDEAHEFIRLKQSMEMVGFSTDVERRIFSVLSAVLHLGNLHFKKKSDHAHHEAVTIDNMEQLKIISNLLKVKEATLMEALTKKKTMAGGETVVMSYKMADAVATKDAMAKCLYGALFDWIVLQVNHALLSNRDTNKEHQGNSIGVLDIFGFEDFNTNSFEQFCINYANEHLHYYFNQHIFKFEQEEYMREGIHWQNIEFIDNTGCLDLFARKPTGLLCLVDEECNFPGATNETLLAKFHALNKESSYYEAPQMKQRVFFVIHYAGKVQYHIKDFREKNSDLMRNDIVLLLKNSSLAFVRELVGYDPVAVLRWAIVRAFFRAYFAFIEAGKRHRKATGNKYGACVRLHSQMSRAQHLTTGHDMQNLFQATLAFSVLKRIHLRTSRKVMIVQKSFEERSSCYDIDSEASDNLGFSMRRSRSYTDPPNFSRLHEEQSPDNSSRSFIYSMGSDNKAMRRASKVLMRNRSFRPNKPLKQLKDLKSMKTLGKTALGPRSSKGKNKPPSVSAQFSSSLQKLMESLNESNPFFIRCIKSNADKAPCLFDEEIVLRQLRYTGMLATVKIRQSGYNYRLTFEEFIHQYKILLSQGLLSSRNDILNFLLSLGLNQNNFQIGKTKVFLREAEKQLLDNLLHQEIMKRIVNIQRWMKTRCERKKFLRLKKATIVIQTHWRSCLAQRKLNKLRLQLYATVFIQKMFRGFRERRRFKKEHQAATVIQSYYRGYRARRRYQSMLEAQLKENVRARKEKDEREKIAPKTIVIPEEKKKGERKLPAVGTMDLSSSTSDEGILLSVTKESSIEELRKGREIDQAQRLDSEGSSGILDDSDTEGSVLVDSGSTSHLSLPASNSAPTTPQFIYSQPLPRSVRHRADRESIDEGVRMRLRSGTQFREPDKSRSISVGQLKTQAGPQDLEILIRPAITKAVSEELLQTYQTGSVSVTKLRDKRVSAPLAKPESFLENAMEDPERAPIVKRLVLDENSRRLMGQTQPKPPSSSPSDSADGPSPFHRSPFHRAKRHFRQIMGVDSMGTHHLNKAISKSEENLLDSVPEVHHQLSSPATTSRSLPRYQEPPYTTTNTTTTVTSDGSTQTTIIKTTQDGKSKQTMVVKVKGGTNGAGGEKDPRSLKKRMAETSAHLGVSRYSKLSLKQLLNSERKKEDRGKKYVYTGDTDESGAEDEASSPVTKAVPKVKESQEGFDALQPHKPKRRKNSIKKRYKHRQKETVIPETNTSSTSWSVSVISQWQYPSDIVVKNSIELQQLDDFLFMKLNALKKDERRDTVFDVVFKGALKEFHNNLLSHRAIAQTSDSKVTFRYKDLMVSFEEALRDRAKLEGTDESFPCTIGINAFRGFIDEFNKKKNSKELPEIKQKKEKKKKDKEKELPTFVYCGHKYIQVQFSIPTFCEVCSSLIWMVEKGYVCQECKLAAHKKCCTKSNAHCKGAYDLANSSQGNQVFGAPLASLLGEDIKVPHVVEKLITAIEVNGLYTVGIYRKPGSAAKIKQLIKDINADYASIDFTDYHIHVLTAVNKNFFRELPEPLLTFDLYDDFIRVTEITDVKERNQALYAVIDKLPPANYDLLERLIFHLANVAQHESSNRMSANGLSIIFAPSILRTHHNLPAQESLQHVPKQTQCVQALIEEQMKKIRLTLADIKTLDTATISAEARLTEVRASLRTKGQQDPPTPTSTRRELVAAQEELLLSQQINSLQQEREALTLRLPTMECRMSSSEEDLLSTDEVESIADELDNPNFDEYAVTFEYPASPPKNLRHLNKGRAQLPVRRRRPSRGTLMAYQLPDSPEGPLPPRKSLSPPGLKTYGHEIIV